jgi:adenylate kinase family enzyme
LPDDTVHHVLEPPQRWYVVGPSGSGKSTYAARLATVLGAAHHELDATFHQADWTPLDREEFRSRVAIFASADRWVIEGNYRAVRALVLARAEIVLALDLPRATVMRQVTRRTWRRWWHHEELWNGNRERLGQFVRWNPERSIIRWAWVSYGPTRERLDWLERVATDNHVPFVRVRTHADAVAALNSLTGFDAGQFLG